MIGSVLPPEAVTSEAYADGPGGAADASPEGTGLFPQELELIARTGPRRRAEFTTTRRCARTALAGLGLPPAPLLRGPRGEPLWPPGVVGSLTHCAGYRAAAVAWGSRIRSLGVDAEPHQELPAGIAGRIAHPEELAALGALPDGLHGGRLLFSAKESVFKAWYPLAHRPLRFDQALIMAIPDHDRPDRGDLQIELLADLADLAPGLTPTGLVGRYVVRRGLVVTSVWTR
jgi:4'-phosphopantetheinyl transferase EntD